jgi:hypothetical protein
MIIDHAAYQSIDFKKYQRIFIFGCSFTQYCWPTWANLLSWEAPHATTYNFAQRGGGNLFISERIIVANQKFCFSSTDLILIMWSTHCREDRYIIDKWYTPGNIFTQNFYSDEFVSKYACPKGYLVRDLALITMIKTCLENFKSDAVMLKAVNPDFDQGLYKGQGFEQVVDLYTEISNSMPSPLYNTVHADDGSWIPGHEYFMRSAIGGRVYFQDYHPNTQMYMEFLIKVGFILSADTQEKAKNYTKELKLLRTRDSINEWYGRIIIQTPNYHPDYRLV